MNKFRFTINAVAVVVFALAFASIAQAQATRTWVSGVGDDANPCSRTAPCKTFAGAISKTAINGEIDALDPGGFGAVTITKSITIDGSATGVAGILNATVTGIIINITSGTDTLRTVVLRGISIQGAGTGLQGVRIVAGNVAGRKVFVENCFIAGQNGSPGRGIEDFRANGGLLSVNNTTIINCSAAGISVDPNGGTGSTQINVSVSNSRSSGNQFGVAFGSNVKATLYNSVFSGNSNTGIFGQQSAGGNTEISVDHCTVSNNTTNGFQAGSANATIRVSNTTAINNGTLAATAGGGQVSSYGNNQTGGLAFPSTPTSQT